ncbi:MAG TPA: heme-binding protein [Pseudomonadota bacterium]|nr:heme-binding protein [Pseudomonadota bacterium]
MGRHHALSLAVALSLALAGCSGGSNTLDPVGTSPPPPTPGTSDSGCAGQCATASSFLTPDDIRRIIAQAVAEAKAQGRPATIVVSDRVGNVLAAYRMAGAPLTQKVSSERGLVGGLEGLDIPAEFGAISKALTAVYFSSEGNAFTSRTAGQIVQEHFNPGDGTSPSGPLFGVQIANLPCSDINVPFNGTGPSPGPHPAPVGLAADPGGISLYKAGVPVGAVGVAADPIYGLDANALDRDPNLDEIIAVAGSFGFAGPTDRRADTITAGGLILRYTNTEFSELARDPATAPGFATLTPADGALFAIPGYVTTNIQRGTAFGQPESGIRPADASEYPPELDAFVVVDPANVNRFPPRAGTEASGALTQAEVRTIAIEAVKVAKRTRAQVRKPLGSPAGETVVVTDSNGAVLAIVRTRDALMDAVDVTTQKARTAAFFSSPNAAADLATIAAPIPYFSATLDIPNGRVDLRTVGTTTVAPYVAAFRGFLGQPNALADGLTAHSSRSIGLLERPLYPDGVPGTPPGPLSPPIERWSLFNTGLQLDLIYTQLAGSIAFYLQELGLQVRVDGTAVTIPPPPAVRSCTGLPRINAGYTLFGGGVPIYRGNTLVGAVAASGDGTDQSDLVAFLGLSNASAALGGSIGQAPKSIRADQLSPRGARLLYVQCPQAPFNNSNENFVCEGL